MLIEIMWRVEIEALCYFKYNHAHDIATKLHMLPGESIISWKPLHGNPIQTS